MKDTKLILTPYGADKWQLVESFTFNGITVPKGKITDLASIPRLLWSFIQPHGRYTKAAVIHDFMCSQSKNKEERKNADKIFYTNMLLCQVPNWKAKIMYCGVRIGAFKTYTLKW